MREEKCHNICHTFYLTLITRYTRYRHQPRLLYISTHIYTYLHISISSRIVKVAGHCDVVGGMEVDRSRRAKYFLFL